MEFVTTNPATNKIIDTYNSYSDSKINEILLRASSSYKEWKNISISSRASYAKGLACELEKDKEYYASLMTKEMGKVKREAIAEIEKCAWMSRVYADNSSSWLAPEAVEVDGVEHKVVFDSLGVIISIMPWNFPFWQALRFGVPSVLAGNVTILKHSNQVPECALAIEKLFKNAGFPEGVFQTVLAGHNQIESLIASSIVQGVSFTGSTGAGRKVAELAGKNLKKVVLELGGSDPFIVLDDADIKLTAKNAALGRLINCGQSCIAAKRFIVMESVAKEFSKEFIDVVSKKVIGDPQSIETDLGPLYDESALEELKAQINDAVVKGATIVEHPADLPKVGSFMKPVVITSTTLDMRVIKEEVFGPVAPIIVVKTVDEAIEVANSSEFGLGGSVWGGDIERAAKVAERLECGSVFVNSIVKSDPRMPFGGVKMSGIGRELSKWGLREFVNVKGVNIYAF